MEIHHHCGMAEEAFWMLPLARDQEDQPCFLWCGGDVGCRWRVRD